MLTIAPVRRSTLFLLAILVLIPALQTSFPKPTRLAAQSFVRISDIQGDGLVSPLRERWIDTFGMVTAITEEGFYLQDPIGDGDERTSEGIYVYLNRRPKVKAGECVLITRAYVDEFYEKTELSKLKSVEPSDRCRNRKIEPALVPLARLYRDPQSLFEAYEGMLVQINGLSGVVQGSTKRFANGEAELALVSAQATVELAGGRVFQAQPQASSALIFVSSVLGGDLPDARWGDRIAIGNLSGTSRQAVGILDYNFEKYQLLLLPEQAVEVQAQISPEPEQAAATKNDEVSICSTNLWALGRGSAQHPNPLDFAQEVKKRAKAIAETLFGCTVIGLQEAGSLEAIEALANELRSQYGLDYAAWAGSGYQLDNPEFPLTTGFLTRKDRVDVNAIEMLQSCSSVDYEVLPGEMECPRGEFLLFDRPSLIADLNIRGEWEKPYRIRVITNHLKSKGGDERVNVVRRTLQAKIVAAKVQSWLDADSSSQVVVLGDLNDFFRSVPVETLRNSVTPALVHTYDLLPSLDRYTYVFNGASQVLDHILVSENLRQQISEVNVLHNNANFAYPEAVDLSNVIHASDHDPIFLRLRPDGAATLGGNLRFPGVDVAVIDESNQLVSLQQSDDRGDVQFWNLRAGKYTVRYQVPAHLRTDQSELTLELSTGNHPLPLIEIEHESLELLRTILETTPNLVNK